jgi:hypothetical protein
MVGDVPVARPVAPEAAAFIRIPVHLQKNERINQISVVSVNITISVPITINTFVGDLLGRRGGRVAISRNYGRVV